LIIISIKGGKMAVALCSTLTEITFIAGTYKELTFDVYRASGSPIDISSWTYGWVLSPFGQPSVASVTKNGIFRTDCTDKNRFTIYLYSSDTSGLSGKYIQQPIITATADYEFRTGQGYINIIPALSYTP
jgi:hypothetical protein